MNKLQISILMLSVFMLTAVATALFYSFYYVVDIEETHMKIIVADFAGFDLNPVNLTFGAVQPGGAGHRGLVLHNVYGIPVKVHIKESGDLSSWVDFAKNNFIMQPGDTETIIATAKIPESAAYNVTHYGLVTVIFTRSW